MTTDEEYLYNYEDDILELFEGFNISDFSEVDTYSPDPYPKAVTFIKLVFPPVHLTIGIVGNILTAIIMYQMIRPVTPLCIYPMMLAFADMTYIVLDILNISKWLATVSGRDFYREVISQSDTLCKTYQFLYNYLAHLTSWITVCIAIETYRCTVIPVRWSHFKKRRVIDSIVLLTVLLSIVNIHYFWTWGKHMLEIRFASLDMNELRCMYAVKNMRGYEETGPLPEVLEQFQWINVEIIPMFVISIVLILLMKVRFASQPTELDSQSDSVNPNCLISLRKRQFMDLRDKSFWAIMLMFLVCHLPYVIVREVNAALLHMKQHDQAESKWSLAIAVFETINTANRSGKFLVYLSTCKRFRLELRALYTSWKEWLLRYICVCTWALKEKQEPQPIAV